MRVVAKNKKAYFDYFIEESIEAGIELSGTEVKSIKASQLNLRDAYISIDNLEAYVLSMHVAKYEKGNIHNLDPYRKRKLLMHKREIVKLYEAVKKQGLTLVPLQVYVNDRGRIKLTVGLVRGKKLYDKRESLKLKDDKRSIERDRQY